NPARDGDLTKVTTLEGEGFFQPPSFFVIWEGILQVSIYRVF
ncbi:MAG: hypothetical protein ACI9AF_001812, partial [Granulosicoccus sp.]